IGFLFARKGVKLTPLIQGGSQEQNLRAGTENMPSIVGMAKALEKAYAHLEAKQHHLWDLKNYLKQTLKDTFPGVEFNGRQEPETALPGVLNVSFPHQEDLMLLFNLDLAGVAASAGSACNSGALQGSHVLRELGASQGAILNTIRFSFGMQNTKEEIDQTVEALKAILSDKVPLGQVD
ncbi:MAG: aminotransferase class V-fold PLP-dependent enzyme, partial [Bacteroidota bacterium]